MMDWLTDHETAGTIGLLFFFTVFAGVAFWAYRPGAKKELESHKYIPLKGDEA